MNDIITFIFIVVFALIPFGIGVVWFLYKKTVVFPVALTVFFSSMFCAIVAFAVSELGWNSLYWAIPLCLVALISANGVFKQLIQKPLKQHRANLDRLADNGDIDFEQSAHYLKKKNEIGDMLRSFRKVRVNLQQTASFADEIAQANFAADYQALGEKDKIGQSLLNMRKSLIEVQEIEKKRKKEDEQRNWVTNGIAKFSDILRQQSENIEEISYTLISNLVDYVGANQGALFIINESEEGEVSYEMKGAVAYGRRKELQVEFNVGEGLVGRCAYEKLPIYMKEVPDSYVNITSGLGECNPRSILLIPAMLNEEVYAVIELVSFDEFEDHKIDFIKKLGETVASTISSAKVADHTQRLLEESKNQSEELAAQEEEMRQNLEELQATQEELTRIQKEEKANNQKTLEEVEKHRKALLKILDHIPLKVFLKDKECNMLIVNKKVLDIHGSTREELLGKNDHDFIDDYDLAQKYIDEDKDIMKTGVPFTEVHKEAIGTDNYILETSKIPFYIDYLDQTGILGVQLDVTENVALKKRVEELEAELKKYKKK